MYRRHIKLKGNLSIFQSLCREHALLEKRSRLREGSAKRKVSQVDLYNVKSQRDIYICG